MVKEVQLGRGIVATYKAYGWLYEIFYFYRKKEMLMRLLRLQGVTASLRVQMETRSEELREKEEELHRTEKTIKDLDERLAHEEEELKNAWHRIMNSFAY